MFKKLETYSYVQTTFVFFRTSKIIFKLGVNSTGRLKFAR